MGVIVDLLGEKTITQADADRYAARVASADRRPAPPMPGEGVGGPSPSSPPRSPPGCTRSPRRLGLAEARERLRPILRAPTAGRLLVWFDMEQYEVKDLTLELFRSM